MNEDEHHARLDLPVDADVLLALAAEEDERDPAARAAGARIAARLLGGLPTAQPMSFPDRAPVLLRVPGWTVSALAAATEGDAERPLQRQIERELGIEFSRTPEGPEQTRISVRSSGTHAAAGDIIRVAVGSEAELLVLLYTDDTGALTGQLVTRSVTMSEDLEISVLRGASLGSPSAAAVTDAVRGSFTAGRNAWRRVAKALEPGDPLRDAIIAGL
ncbi:hypothetical protein ACFVMC_28540 [Nocardia sp. NPDC127579]|uniref:hypothetical protein n=1 Tax=Nocardia sp. NPDC127579 TaxID=3345402 RepID=UPI00363C49BF